MKQVIYSDGAPKPIGPYSQGVKVGATLYCSGQIAIDPRTGELILDNIERETEQVMKNIQSVLQKAKMDFSNVIKSTIYVRNMDLFERINNVYGKYFTPEHYPARETVEVSGLPKGVNVEVSVIASRE